MDTLQDVFNGSSNKEIDYIQYAIYLPPKESEAEMMIYLKDTLDMINSHIQPLVKDFIWQKDKFHLSIVHDQQHDPSFPFLFGATRFGDCVNDEWFIVHLLKTISKQIPECVISLLDNDGDVLLIEAALELPGWLDPANSDNRVYLYQDQVHIIPLPNTPAAILHVPATGRLFREKAIQQVRSHPHVTLASPSIQRAIQDRVHTYPELHRTTCILPNKAAFVLLSEPQLITLAIEAFYLRDPLSMKACAAMSTFPPQEGSTETTIRFTKTTYAQAKSQKFYAPKPFRLPSVHERTKFAKAELGMKVACGLEMLYHHQRTHVNSNSSNDVATYPFDKDKKYTAYVDHLKKLGYFRSEREGSQLYKALEKQSKEQYLLYREQDSTHENNIVSYDHLDAEDDETFRYSSQVLSSGTAHQRIDKLLSQYSIEALQALVEKNVDVEDSDAWMNVDPQQLEELLMKRMGHMNEQMMSDMAKDFGLSEGGVDLEAIMSNFENFVENSESGVDGVVFPGEKEEDEDDEDDSDVEYDDEDEEEAMKAIQFDMEKFMSILKGAPAEVPVEQDLGQVMEEMDQEIYGHDKISGSFAKLSTNDNDDEEEEDEGAPVDVQLNLVKNVLESFKSQQGLPGPVSNILNQFGVVLPGDNNEE